MSPLGSDTPGQPDDSALPDYYVNQLGIALSTFDLAMTWGRRSPAGTLEQLVRTTMSLEHAVTTYALLGRLLRQYFAENDMKAAIPQQVLEELGIQAEDLPW